jgi:DNA (cytosine-5)-methyltransferase 1
MVIVDCGVEITGPLSARDYKDPGTDGLNKNSAKMVPVINPTYAIQGSMIGRNDNAGPQGDGINVEVCFTQNTIDRHAVAQPIALQDITSREKAQNGKGWNADGSAYTVDTHATQGVATPMAVRRLTPVECERLQGFPDGYTNIPWRKAAESPDGPRYKALGNSWAVPVVAWIGKRIQDQIK